MMHVMYTSDVTSAVFMTRLEFTLKHLLYETVFDKVNILLLIFVIVILHKDMSQF